jgi:hypothetical protein
MSHRLLSCIVLLMVVLGCLCHLVPFMAMLTRKMCAVAICVVILCTCRAAADSPALLVHAPSLDRRDVFGLLGSSLLGSTFSQLYPAMLGLTSAGKQS